jgi:hypothetical protein
MMDYLGAVRASTDHLRSSELSGWSRVRDFLIERGIRPEEAALAVIYPDDVTVLTAVVVADAQRMFEIDLEYPAGVDKAMAMSQPRIESWRDDAARIALENRDFVQAALDVLSRGG